MRMFINRGWNGAKSEAVFVSFQHGRYVNIHCTKGDLGNESKSHIDYFDKGWKEVTCSDFYDRMDDAGGEYRNLILNKMHELYWMLRKNDVDVRSFYHDLFKNALELNRKNNCGITYMNTHNPNFEYKVDYQMFEHIVKNEKQIELKVMNMYGTYQWIHLEEARVTL